MALAIVVAGMFIIAPTSGDPNMATFAGKWVSMQNQYADGVNCSNGEPTIGMELYIREQTPREVRLIQITGEDRLQFAFPVGAERPGPETRVSDRLRFHSVVVDVTGDMIRSGTVDVPNSALDESRISSLILSGSEMPAPFTLASLGITKDERLPVMMVQAASSGVTGDEQVVLTADQFTRCFL